MKQAAREHQAIVHRLARLHAVQTSFVDGSGVTRKASTESLARVLAALGSPCATEAQARGSERDRIVSLSARRIAPVSVAWRGRRPSVEFVLAKSRARSRLEWTLRLEGGEVLEGAVDASRLATQTRTGPHGGSRLIARLPLPAKLPDGYHRLRIDHAGERLESLIICAPVKSFRHEPGVYEREWGVFAPLYSLRSERNTGCADLTDLRELARWSIARGGRVLATLPMLAGFLGERAGPFDPSPYAPVSRLFWNELFIDPERTPEFAHSSDARSLMSSTAFRRDAAELRAASLVDYRRAAALKRSVLELLAEKFHASGGAESAAFRAYLAECPQVIEYAQFRAVTEKQGAAWTDWPARLRRGSFSAEDADLRAVRYHVYVQHAAWLELLALGSELKAAGGLMYFDLPVGVSPFGYDVWKNRELFALGCSTGAPPDPYFTGGQNWGFPPMHPEACREEGYAYLRASLRNHMRHADYLRLDHVMAFHRLFWIPEGLTAADGVYVQYHPEEIYAILCLESHRQRCRLVGENLGTVPPIVNKALTRHDLCGLYVAQYEVQPKSPALRPVPVDCVASINTHDMPPLAAFWSGQDIEDRIALDMLAPERRAAERTTRENMKRALIALLRRKKLLTAGKVDAARIRDALLASLGAGPADFVLVNIEDLWLETLWQNVPGTMDEHPNWRRKLRLSLDQIVQDRSVAGAVAALNSTRRGKRPAKRRTTNSLKLGATA